MQRKVDPTYVSDLFENTDIANKCVNCSFKRDGRGKFMFMVFKEL